MPGRLGLEPSNVGVCFIIRSYANTTNLQEMNLLPPIIANTLPYTSAYNGQLFDWVYTCSDKYIIKKN